MPYGNQPVTVSHPPKIFNFSGAEKSEVLYEQWNYEVSCLIKEKFSDETKANVIRRSHRGEAGKVAVRLGHEAPIPALLSKWIAYMESLSERSRYLLVNSKDNLLQNGVAG